MTDPDHANQLVFLPLGGAGEIGMNFNLYGYGPRGHWRWLAVDLGVAFSSGEPPGTDVLMPDPAYLEERLENLDGLLLTHAHEDHLGAVPYLWPRLRCPVYATRFALAVLKRKLIEAGLAVAIPLIEVPLGGRFQIGPFNVELVTLTHSIPEPNAVAIRTGGGLLLHTGDWKLDPDPIVGPRADEHALNRLGDEGVVAMICDSTNALESGSSGSEGALSATLNRIVEEAPGRVTVTCFASNIARLRTIATAAIANGRRVVIAGSSLRRNVAAARECHYFADLPEFVEEGFGQLIPKDKVLYICTGSQGEKSAALSRMAAGSHPRLSLDPGDTVVFSSRVIPGNEIAIGRVQNALLRQGISVITPRDAAVHVSGHPARDELERMYRMVRPQVAIPVHGELRHLLKHSDIARGCGVAEVIVAENGTLVRITPLPAAVEGTVPSGRLALEGKRLVSVDGNLVRERTRAIYNGAVVVTIVLREGRCLVSETQVSTVGLLDAREDSVLEGVCGAVEWTLRELSPAECSDDDKVREAVQVGVRRVFLETLGKKPLTFVHVVRFEQTSGGKEK